MTWYELVDYNSDGFGLYDRFGLLKSTGQLEKTAYDDFRTRALSMVVPARHWTATCPHPGLERNGAVFYVYDGVLSAQLRPSRRCAFPQFHPYSQDLPAGGNVSLDPGEKGATAQADSFGSISVRRGTRWVRLAALLSAIALCLFPIALFVRGATERFIGFFAGAGLAVAAFGILIATFPRTPTATRIRRPFIIAGFPFVVGIALPVLSTVLIGAENSVSSSTYSPAVFSSRPISPSLPFPFPCEDDT